MVSIKIGRFMVEVAAGVKRVTTVYSNAAEPRYVNVVDTSEDGELTSWSLAQDGTELGTRPKGVRVLGKGQGRPVKLA